MNEAFVKFRQYILSGVSFAIPFIACGGILIAAATASVPMTSTGPDFNNSPIARLVETIGETSFLLMLPVLAGYIANAMAGKPGLVPGFVGGYLAGHLDGTGKVSAGFLGALAAGLLAGWFVNLIKKIPFPKVIRPILPILILPIFSSLAVGIIILKVVGPPVAGVMQSMSFWLSHLDPANAVLLGSILGAMIAVDMGGPMNKVAFFFGSGLIEKGNFYIMGACAAAICTPPLGMGLATLLQKKLWTAEQREAGAASLAMGFIGITEGAIPFAAADPFRVIPCLVLGSMTASVIALLGKVGDHAPHGGPIVLLVIDNPWVYVEAMVAGTLVTAISANLVKTFFPPPPSTTTPTS